MDTVLVFIIGFCMCSFAYCIVYWCWMYHKKSEPVQLTSYDSGLPEPAKTAEPGFEFPTPPPTYDEANRIYKETIAMYGMRHRNSQDVIRKDDTEEAGASASPSTKPNEP